MIRQYNCCSHVSKMPILSYNRGLTALLIKNVIILNIIHNIFNLLDPEVIYFYIVPLEYYRLLHGIFHIIPSINPRSWDQPESRQAQGMIYERGLIKGMIWKMTCYDMFIIYFNRGNNWFLPKCLVILAGIKYM